MLSTSTHAWVTRHELMSFFWLCLFHGLSHPHLLISQLLIFTPAQLQNNNNNNLDIIITFPSLSVFLSLSFSLSSFFPLSLSRLLCRYWRGVTKCQPFRTKWGSMGKNWGKVAVYLCRSKGFAQNEGRSSKTEVKMEFYLWQSNPFAQNDGRSSQTELYCIFFVPDLSWRNPFARNEGRCSKTEAKMRFYLCRTSPGATLWHETGLDAQKLKKNCQFIFNCARATLSHESVSMSKNGSKTGM
jgi:hypothetical protein